MNPSGAKRHPLLLLLLLPVLAGGALRLWHPELMSFRFDSAEVLFRARETLALGYPPLMGS
jgi:hypothetical protein